MTRLMVLVCLLLNASACSGATGNGDLPDKGIAAGDTMVAKDSVADHASDSEPDSRVVQPDLAEAGGLVINEVAPKGTPDDWFELYNTTDEDIVLDGWTFSDNVTEEPKKATFPAASVVVAHGFLQVVIDDSYGFGLGDDEELGLFNPAGLLVDHVDWDKGAAGSGESYGRVPDGTGAFKTLDMPTPGKGND